MANSDMSRLRRFSYAGQEGLQRQTGGQRLSQVSEQKSRRVSVAVGSSVEEANQQHQHHSRQSSQSGIQSNTTTINGQPTTGSSNTSSSATMYDNVSAVSRTSMDVNRVNRRISKPAEDSFTCSQQSILSAMDRFVKCVNNMDSTVLVPSKLRDMDIPSGNVKMQRIPPALANTDLHSFYLMLNDVKKELLWGPGTAQATATTMVPVSGRSSPRELGSKHGHVRQPSDDSLGSLGSTASSSSDQDTDSDADSMMTDRDSIDEHTSHLASAFRHHLQGLHTILHQLADSADYLSSRYQEEIDASSL